ncbi:ferric reductase-like transmembrane domain-containing protein [Actinophytocola sp.]|jgi:predicted ferric reductase|uniref:ferric reductase-like transmembrane domain-containing protein n=1 Tax=Actinophytocola sp. TaxID=1872138 RepID=UPI002ED8A695
MTSLWYASRAAGLLALVLITGTVVLGALTGGRASSAGWPRFAVAALHRNLALLTITFVVVHVATAVIDGYAGIAWLDTVLPFVSVYHPFWLGLGAAAFDLLLALVVTSLLRSRVNPRLWRAVHWAAYACWPVALVHGFGIGAGDTRTGWGLAVVLGCLAAGTGAVLWRLSTSHPDSVARQQYAGRAR